MRTMNEDHHLIKGCLANDRRSQRKLYDKYSSKMLGICMRYANKIEDAEDMMIEGFMKIFTGLNEFRNESSLVTWMHRIMINNAINYFQKNCKHYHTESISDESFLDDIYDTSYDIPEKITQKMFLDIMQKMPEKYRIVLNLIALDGYSYETVSKQLAIPEATVRSRLSKAKQFLHKHFYQQ